MPSGSDKRAFVFVVCGERHATRLNDSLRFLRRFSKSGIIVVKARVEQPVAADKVVSCRVPRQFDNHQASIFLKTSLHRILPDDGMRYCYLDNDVVAVNPEVDSIFSVARPPIAFAADHCNLREFSRYAVNCRCSKLECEHLHAAIRRKFGVAITDKSWRHWNGGVFVFDRASRPFMEVWHQFTLEAFRDRYWKVRDQGTLAAAAWKLGLQSQPTLPRNYNLVVDPYAADRTPRSKRRPVDPRKLPADSRYALDGGASAAFRPMLLHFINGGVGLRGWKNWDDAERLLGGPAKPAPAPAPKPLSPDNRIVHGLWIGGTLSKMELLTVHSFLRHGHEFHLWTYGDLETPLPKGVVLEDANEIIPQSRIMRKADTDPETGVGKGSVSPFSDLFRYKLLYEKGGWWVDMDVTCLRPFDFDTPYVFRAHRVGVVGNIIKCPRGSRLMETLYEQVVARLDRKSDWLMTNRMLSERVRRLRLTRYVRKGIWNEEKWTDVIQPLALGSEPIPPEWYAIHWINEFWRTLRESGGFYRGQRLFEVVPDKENPAPNSSLSRLYAQHLPAPSAPAPAPAPPPAPMNRPSPRQPPTPQFPLPSHLNILVASMARGGAERIVLETVTGLQRRGSTAKVFVYQDVRPSFTLPPGPNVRVFALQPQEPAARLHTVATEVLASPEPRCFTHLIRVEHLRRLWERNVQTIPVIHNSRECWQDPPEALNDPHVPYVVAVSEEVARQLREDGCSRPILVVRHELQRWFSPQDHLEHRRRIRERHEVSDRTFLIGMVGEFKSQKVYTRAVRVLAQLRRHLPAKLIILGGWDHAWGHGRQAYTAAHRLAVDLDVVPDFLTPGSVPNPEEYYAAFDVFLNTSAYEGLSISLLEAINSGCPIVTADVGGNREVLPDRAVLVRDPSNIGSYVSGIVEALNGAGTRALPQKPADSDLIPRLWCLLGRYHRPGVQAASPREGTLFLTDNLNIGGAQKSLVNLLCGLPRPRHAWLAVLDPIYGEGYLDRLNVAEVPVLSLCDLPDYLTRLERILAIVSQLNLRNICFWNVDPRVKLLLAKILAPGSVRLIDVSPGPFLFEELAQTAGFQRRIAFGDREYWARIDHFVAKYKGGGPPDGVLPPSKVSVIPNGVPVPASLDRQVSLLPRGCDHDLVIGTACRIMPGKKVDFLIDVMAELNRRLPGVQMIVVGGIDPRHADYWPALAERLRSRQVSNLHFVGPQADVGPYLNLFRAFVLLGEKAGCPNASLEAMVRGVPVVADCDGGIGEQILHGINGFLAPGRDPRELARHLRFLLSNPEARRRMGEAARITATKDFSMEAMVRGYRRVLEDPAAGPAPAAKPAGGRSRRPVPSRKV